LCCGWNLGGVSNDIFVHITKEPLPPPRFVSWVLEGVRGTSYGRIPSGYDIKKAYKSFAYMGVIVSPLRYLSRSSSSRLPVLAILVSHMNLCWSLLMKAIRIPQ
jgi:hypothetical protein